MAEPWRLVLSCEHGGNQVPAAWRHLFAAQQAILACHRGYDLGIRALSQELAAALHTPVEIARVTRLLVDLNRSLGNPSLFSEFSKSLPAADKEALLRRYYHPYRQRVEQRIAELLESGQRVIHLALHSFTPVLRGHIRNADIGLLYDPARTLEKSFCLLWQQSLAAQQPTLRIRRNYPYRGNADAFVTLLRRTHPAQRYLGLELELNQALLETRPRTAAKQLCPLLANSLRVSIESLARLAP